MSDKENNEPAAEELLSHDSYEALLKQLNDAEQKLNDQEERMLRMRAEAENSARRLKREVDDARKFGNKDLIGELLPIIDSLELSINNISNDKSEVSQSLIEGVNLILKMFYAVMEKFGIKQLNPISEPFNPEFEQAISMQIDTSVKPGTVISVLQKGYTLNDRLIRPALVVVAKGEGE